MVSHSQSGLPPTIFPTGQDGLPSAPWLYFKLCEPMALLLIVKVASVGRGSPVVQFLGAVPCGGHPVRGSISTQYSVPLISTRFLTMDTKAGSPWVGPSTIQVPFL